MAYKTMLRQLISKWGVMTIELQKAYDEDSKQEQAEEYLQTEEPRLPTQQPDLLPDAPASESVAGSEVGQVSLDEV